MASYQHAGLFRDRVGLELGGPSPIYCSTGLYPIYRLAARIDSCNFSGHTTWDGLSRSGGRPRGEGAYARGSQFIAEAAELSFLPAESYDFVLSSHMLEHCANPLKALDQWQRILKTGGALLLVLPHREATFDHKRPVTELQHLAQDFRDGVGEDDLRHLPEILQLHDLQLDPLAGGFDSFQARSRNNAQNRCLHHHVFDTRLAVQMLDLMKFQIIAVEPRRPNHIAVLCVKPQGGVASNAEFSSSRAAYRQLSPFRSDRDSRELQSQRA